MGSPRGLGQAEEGGRSSSRFAEKRRPDVAVGGPGRGEGRGWQGGAAKTTSIIFEFAAPPRTILCSVLHLRLPCTCALPQAAALFCAAAPCSRFRAAVRSPSPPPHPPAKPRTPTPTSSRRSSRRSRRSRQALPAAHHHPRHRRPLPLPPPLSCRAARWWLPSRPLAPSRERSPSTWPSAAGRTRRRRDRGPSCPVARSCTLTLWTAMRSLAAS